MGCVPGEICRGRDARGAACAGGILGFLLASPPTRGGALGALRMLEPPLVGAAELADVLRQVGGR